MTARHVFKAHIRSCGKRHCSVPQNTLQGYIAHTKPLHALHHIVSTLIIKHIDTSSLIIEKLRMTLLKFLQNGCKEIKLLSLLKNRKVGKPLSNQTKGGFVVDRGYDWPRTNTDARIV